MFIHDWIDNHRDRKAAEESERQKREAKRSRILNTLVAAVLLDEDGVVLGRIRRRGCVMSMGCVIGGKERVAAVLCNARAVIPCDGNNYVPAHRVHSISLRYYREDETN